MLDYSSNMENCHGPRPLQIYSLAHDTYGLKYTMALGHLYQAESRHRSPAPPTLDLQSWTVPCLPSFLACLYHGNKNSQGLQKAGVIYIFGIGLFLCMVPKTESVIGS
jgi:hypothetical protein